jgi:formamidopyrimidine-DNA glycosylase
LLLDQRIVSGIGNIYADETLFHAGIHPTKPGGEVADKGRVIIASARTILNRAIKHGGSTLRDYRKHDGSKGDFQRFHAVYGREGEKCVRCGSLIQKIVLAGRGTHLCPRCQR